MLRKLILVTALLASLSLLTGCGTTGDHIQSYPGPQRTASEVSLVNFQRDSINNRSVVVSGIDGTKFSMFALNNTEQIELLPGPHVLELRTCILDSRSTKDIKMSLNCEAGHNYNFYVTPIKGEVESQRPNILLGGSFYGTIWAVDEQTEEVVAGHRFTKYYFTNIRLFSLGDGQKGHRTVTPTFSPADVLYLNLDVQVDDPVNQLEKHDITLQWYKDSQLLPESNDDQSSFSFDGTLNKLSLKRRPLTFGQGHFRLEVLVKGEKATSEEFDVAP
jgi:hypothetical protein